MRPLVTKGLEALGALLAIALLWAVAIALQGCSRAAPAPPPAPPAAPVLEDGECHGDDCMLPGAMR